MESGEKKFMIMMLVPDLPVNLHQIRGGVHAAVISLLEGFSNNKDANIHVITFTNKVSSTMEVEFSNNCNITYMREGIFKYHLLNYIFFSTIKLKNTVNKLKPDIIHYQVGNAFLFSKLLLKKRTPYFQTIHGFSNYEAKIKHRLIDKIKWKLNYLINVKYMIDNIIHLSHFSDNIHLNERIKNKRIIPNAVKSNYFSIEPKKKFESKLLFIGQLDTNKNALYAIELLYALSRQDHEFTLEIAGGMSDRAYYKLLLDKIKELDIQDKITFHGWINEEEKIKLLKKTDILIVPSYHESYPMVVLEGLAAAKIILANHTGGIPEIIHNNNIGYLLNINKKEDWVKSVQFVKEHNEVRLQIQDNARKYASNRFSCETVAKETYNFYKQISLHANN